MHEKRNNQNSCMLPTLKWSIYENRMHFGPIQMCRFDGRKKTNLVWIWLMIHWYIFNRTISNECERMAEIKKKTGNRSNQFGNWSIWNKLCMFGVFFLWMCICGLVLSIQITYTNIELTATGRQMNKHEREYRNDVHIIYIRIRNK